MRTIRALGLSLGLVWVLNEVWSRRLNSVPGSGVVWVCQFIVTTRYDMEKTI